MKTILVTLTIMISLAVNAQDESRWTAGLGYFTNLSSHSFAGIENDHSMVKLGLSRHIRLNENNSVLFGLEVAKLSIDIPSYKNDIFGPLIPAHDASSTMVTLYFGGKKEAFEGLFHYSVGLLFEYDFGAPDEIGYALQNGLGFFLGIGKDIHISDEFVISIDPMIRLRSGVNFRGGEKSEILDSPNHNVFFDAGAMISLGYKIF